jgi:hypothetical protein
MAKIWVGKNQFPRPRTSGPIGTASSGTASSGSATICSGSATICSGSATSSSGSFRIFQSTAKKN